MLLRRDWFVLTMARGRSAGHRSGHGVALLSAGTARRRNRCMVPGGAWPVANGVVEHRSNRVRTAQHPHDGSGAWPLLGPWAAAQPQHTATARGADDD